MKRFQLIIKSVIGVIFILSCNSSRKLAQKQVEENQLSVENFSQSEISIGENLIAKNDCYTCHRYKEKLVGPALSAIANKYEYMTVTDFNKLSEKSEMAAQANGEKYQWFPMHH